MFVKEPDQRNGRRTLLQRARQPQLSSSSAASGEAARFGVMMMEPVKIMRSQIPQRGASCKPVPAVAPKERSPNVGSQCTMIF
jgi:hypothetical protein